MAVEDLQSGWLLLLMCGATRAIFWLRTVRPRRQRLAMHGAVDVSGSVGDVPNIGIIAVPFGRHGFGQCSEGQRGRPVGQLGRLHQNGEAAPSAHRSNHDAEF